MEKTYTPWDVFLLAVSLMIAFMGGLLWRVENVKTEVADLKTDIAVVKSDTAWIKQILEKQNQITRANTP